MMIGRVFAAIWHLVMFGVEYIARFLRDRCVVCDYVRERHDQCSYCASNTRYCHMCAKSAVVGRIL